MASLAAFTVSQPTAVKGLSGSKPHLKTSSFQCPQAHRRVGALAANYCEKSLHGFQASPSKDPVQAALMTKRGLLLNFLILGGGVYARTQAEEEDGGVVPVVYGPQLPPELGRWLVKSKVFRTQWLSLMKGFNSFF